MYGTRQSFSVKFWQTRSNIAEPVKTESKQAEPKQVKPQKAGCEAVEPQKVGEKRKKAEKESSKKMKRIMEFLLITLLAFVVTTAFLTVDKRSAENIGYAGIQETYVDFRK